MSADEMVELQKLLSTYGDPMSSSGPSGGTRAAQAEAVARAARASATHEAVDPSEPPPEEVEAGPEGNGAPVEHYDDLEADEIVGLLDSLEDRDLQALRDYERDAHGRPRVLAAIDAVVARRAGGPVG
jgi:hypothetical protein